MGYAFTLDDVAYLRSVSGEGAVRAAMERELSPASRLADVEAMRGLVGDRAAAVLETASLRRRAEGRVGTGDWLFTDAALQQATATRVARHRARRLTGRDVHDVTCSIGAELAEIAPVARRCAGSDLDEVRLTMARHNLRGRVPLLVADALRPTSRGTVVIADPARRDDAGRRTWKPADFSPRLDELSEVYTGRDLVVKCAPGLDFTIVPWADEIEVVSLSGGVRESVLWTGDLATAGISRRASVLNPDGTEWTITDAEPADCPVREPADWIIDPDGAVVRAGLVQHYATRHGLGQLDPRIAYLTGDRPPPGIRAFKVFDHARYREKSFRTLLRQHQVGRLEILVRGVEVDPNTLRGRLRLHGPAEATAIITRIGHSPHVFLTHPHRT